MEVTNLLRERQQFLNCEVTIEGKICVTGGGTFLAASSEEFSRGERVRLVDENVVSKTLYSTLPASGGGCCCYCEDASVTGTLREFDDELILEDIKKCNLTSANVIINAFGS